MPSRRLLFLLFLAALLMAMVQLGVLSIAFDKLGLPPGAAILVLGATLLGSGINLPLFALRADGGEGFRQRLAPWRQDWGLRPGYTVIAVNLGGCLVPVLASLYLFLHTPVAPLETLAAVGLVTLIAYQGSVLLPGVGIVMPALIVPAAAAFVGVSLDPAHGAVLAYIGGTLGVLIGADVMRLKDIGGLGEPVASIGGAGSLDGIFITGLFAALLA